VGSVHSITSEVQNSPARVILTRGAMSHVQAGCSVVSFIPQKLTWHLAILVSRQRCWAAQKTERCNREMTSR
jgi:hypothetical protein